MNKQNYQRRGFWGVLSALLAFFVCCNVYGASNTNNQGENPSEVTTEGEAKQYDLVVNYTGNIGKYAIRMTLNFDTGLGTYYYTGKGANHKLSLRMYRNENFLKLVESNHEGTITGVFEGHISRNGVYSGLFTAYTGTVNKFRVAPTE
ncbi:MAG: hypothetical protein IKT82_06275 [Bacteroidaceae bacterium]|nr:hypothetical protein [Bacteroidaceae bacterium]